MIDTRFLATLLALTLTLSACQSTLTPQQQASAEAERGDVLFASIREQEREWAGLETNRLEVAGYPLVYSRGGADDAPVLLMLHGYSGSRDDFNRVASYLVDDFQLIIPDLPGHGATPLAPEQDVSAVATVERINALVDKLGIDRFHVVGHSLGGAYAIQVAITRISRVNSLTLIASAGVYENNPSDVMARINAGENPLLVREQSDLARVMALVMAEPPFVPRELHGPLYRYQSERQANYRRVFQAIEESRDHFTPQTFRSGLGFIRAPVLLLWGEKDALFPPVVLDEIQPAFRNAQRVVLPGIGHMPPREAPRLTAQAIAEHVRSLPSSLPQ